VKHEHAQARLISSTLTDRREHGASIWLPPTAAAFHVELDAALVEELRLTLWRITLLQTLRARP
jgi:hypothetical protein